MPGRTAPTLFWPEVWLAITALFALDLTWGAWIGFSVGDLARVLGAVAMLLGLTVAYMRRSRTLADMAQMAALWTTLSGRGAVLTYLAATCALPLQDALLMRWDSALGFSWLGCHDALAGWPLIQLLLSCAYDSLMPQILLSCVLLPALCRTERCVQLILLAAMGLVLTASVSALCPVLGPRAAFGMDDLLYVSHIQALRGSGPWRFDMIGMQGIVTMPSYHTVLAVLFTHAYRGMGKVGWTIAGLNVLMLASIPPIGGHYLVDMAAGSAIGVLCILAARLTLRDGRKRPSQVPA